MSTPQSRIYICNGVRLDNRYEHTITFDNVPAQHSFFMDKVVHTLSAYTYLRRTWNLKVALPAGTSMASAQNWNYLFFTNDNYSDELANTYYYYFINHVEYVNDSTVELTLELDVMQTHHFDFALQPCFVERHHTESDEVGEHLVAEDLELGDLVSEFAYDAEDMKDLCILILSTYNPQTTGEDQTATVLASCYDGVFSGLGVYAVNMESWQALGSKLYLLSEAGKIDGIVSIWVYPKSLVELAEGETWDGLALCKGVAGTKKLPVTVAKKQSKLGNYTPKNKKVLTYPFNFLYASNNAGTASVYRYERFTNDKCEFELSGALSPEGVARCTPQYYNGVANNYDEGITLAGYPTCAWNSDTYKIWLAQNQNTNNLSMATSGLSIAGGVATSVAGLATGNLVLAGAGAMTAIHGGTQIASTLAAKKDMEVQPPQARGNFSSNVNVVNGKQLFSFYFKRVDDEHARIIDDYFTMYGYRINKKMTPNPKARPAYTYIKTIGCLIHGTMCTEDIVKIESIFDKGITFWRDGDQIGNYNQDNAPS